VKNGGPHGRKTRPKKVVGVMGGSNWGREPPRGNGKVNGRARAHGNRRKNRTQRGAPKEFYGLRKKQNYKRKRGREEGQTRGK